jgi:excisionase family DNA binding protein
MPRTKARMKKPRASDERSNGIQEAPDVLTLDEAAAYLRVAPDAVLRMIGDEQLPARRFGSEWRFAKAAVQAWLASGPPQAGLMEEFGKMKDDPYLEEMLRDIYKRRGRPEVEEA